MKISSLRNRLTLLFSLVLMIGFVAGLAMTDTASAAKKSKKRRTSTKTTRTTKKAPKIDPNDPTSVIYLGTKGQLAGTGDPNKPAGIGYRKGRAWHPQALSAAGLPRDKFGLIDWAKIVREGLIKPKASLDPKAEEMPPLKLDIVIPAKGDYVNDVLYPHEIHTWWLKCEVCHPKIFIPAKGQNKMSMVGIAQGKWCGRCHNKVAFPLSDCKRCHTVPKKRAKK